MKIISHFYNEEYLLPWWLRHHREIFDDGLMINYNSTDNSVAIIKKLCPHWTVIDSENKYFEAYLIDREIEKYEKKIDGFRIVLNTSEFLIGNFSKINQNEYWIIAMTCMVDHPENDNTYPDSNIALTKQKFHGINPFRSPENFMIRRSRLLHKDKNIFYPIGRHYGEYNSKDFMILRFDYSPWNEKILHRKIQIGTRQPQSELDQGFGLHHQWDEKMHNIVKKEIYPKAEDIKFIIQNYEYWNY
jgi:hypothetical protein